MWEGRIVNRFQNVLIHAVSVIDHSWIDYGQYVEPSLQSTGISRKDFMLLYEESEILLTHDSQQIQRPIPTTWYWNIQFFMWNCLILKSFPRSEIYRQSVAELLSSTCLKSLERVDNGKSYHEFFSFNISPRPIFHSRRETSEEENSSL